MDSTINMIIGLWWWAHHHCNWSKRLIKIMFTRVNNCSNQWQQRLLEKTKEEQQSTWWGLLSCFPFWVKCKDTCTCNPQKSLLSLDGLNNKPDWFFYNPTCLVVVHNKAVERVLSHHSWHLLATKESQPYTCDGCRKGTLSLMLSLIRSPFCLCANDICNWLWLAMFDCFQT